MKLVKYLLILDIGLTLIVGSFTGGWIRFFMLSISVFLAGVLLALSLYGPRS